MAGKEIKIEVVEQIKIIAKQLENLKRQREEDQVFLAGLVQRLTALEQRLPALPPPPVSVDATAAHGATSTSLTISTNNTSGAHLFSEGIAAATPPSYSSNPIPNPSPILPPKNQQLVQLTPSTEGLQLEEVEVEKLRGDVPHPPTAGLELVKKYHVLLDPQREDIVFSTSQNTANWCYTSSMWGYLGRQPWPPPEQLEDELLVKG